MALDPLLEYRREFPALEKSVYLVSHSMGAMPRGVYDAFQEFCDAWVDRAAEAYEDTWIPMVDEHARRLAEILGAPEASITFGTNVSQLQAVIASCLEFTRDRNKVVYADSQFPSVSYVWKAEERRGAQVHILPLSEGQPGRMRLEDRRQMQREQLLSAIDERTKIVAVEMVSFRDGYLQDIRALADRTHQVGALIVVDAYQAVGTVPVNVEELDVDFLCGGSHKWLCGGAGCAFLYTRPSLLPSLEPRVTGWFGHREPFAFRMPAQEYADGPWRLMGGTWPVACLYQARPGAEMVRRIGVRNIREKSIRQTQWLFERALADGYRVTSPRDPSQRNGMICFDLPDAQKVLAELARRGFLCDFRPGTGLRVSPHFYTTDDELSAFMDEVKKVARR